MFEAMHAHLVSVVIDRWAGQWLIPVHDKAQMTGLGVIQVTVHTPPPPATSLRNSSFALPSLQRCTVQRPYLLTTESSKHNRKRVRGSNNMYSQSRCRNSASVCHLVWHIHTATQLTCHHPMQTSDIAIRHAL